MIEATYVQGNDRTAGVVVNMNLFEAMMLVNELRSTLQDVTGPSPRATFCASLFQELAAAISHHPKTAPGPTSGEGKATP